LLKSDSQRAGTNWVEGFDDEFIFTTWWIDRELSTCTNV
jgi:hypothetical protein